MERRGAREPHLASSELALLYMAEAAVAGMQERPQQPQAAVVAAEMRILSVLTEELEGGRVRLLILALQTVRSAGAGVPIALHLRPGYLAAAVAPVAPPQALCLGRAQRLEPAPLRLLRAAEPAEAYKPPLR